MKSLFICLLLALAGQSLAQSENEFIQYLLDIQSQAEEAHDVIESTLNNIRFQLSEELVHLNEQLIARLNSALQEVQDIREETERFVAESSAPARCVDVAVANWAVEIHEVGHGLSHCANRANVAITSSTANVHAALENAQIESTELQNIVVRGFIDWNAIDFTEDLAYIVGTQINNRLDYFTRITQPDMERILQGVSDLNNDLLPDIVNSFERCVERFNNYGRVIRDTLFFCSQ